MNRDQTRDLAAFILVGALVAGAAQHFIGSPAARALAVASAEASDARASLAAFQSSPVIADPVNERTQLQRLCALAVAHGRPARDAEALLSGIHRIAAECDISIDAVRPTGTSAVSRPSPTPQAAGTTTADAAKPAAPDTVLNCDISLRGEYDGVIRFLLRLNELGWHKVRSLRIAPTGADAYPTTEARLELSLFDFALPEQALALSNTQGAPTPPPQADQQHSPQPEKR